MTHPAASFAADLRALIDQAVTRVTIDAKPHESRGSARWLKVVRILSDAVPVVEEMAGEEERKPRP